MSAFLIFFLTTYTAMHALVFFSARVLFGDRWVPQVLCGIFFAAMIVAPLGARLLEKNGYESLAQLTALIAYSWLGFLFLSFCMYFLRGVLIVLARLLNLFAGASIPVFDGVASALAVLCIVVIFSVYGYFEARSVRVERVEIETAKLPPGVDRIKIAQISDVHLGLMANEEPLSVILEKVRREKPDILVCTGDLIDGNLARINQILKLFSTVQPRLGKYAVTGNHEFYAGLGYSLESIRRFGFRVLRGEAIEVGGVLNIVGVDDPTSASPTNEAALLRSSQNGLFTLFLKHRPSAPAESQGLYDLQLSGHTHRGQIFPFNFVTGSFYPMQNGFYDLGKGSRLYTSRGSGTWGPPMRVLSPPEVSVFELVRVGWGKGHKR